MKTLLTITLTLLFAFSAQAQDIYDVFSSLPTKADRKELLRLQSPEIQHQLWQKHLAIALTKNEYTSDQRRLVKESKKLGNIEFFRTDKTKWQGTPLQKKYDNLQKRIREAFKDQPMLYYYTFELMGDPSSLLKEVSCVDDRKASFIKVSAKMMRPDCNCNWSASCDNWVCGQVQGGCTEVINCGVFGGSACGYICGGMY